MEDEIWTDLCSERRIKVRFQGAGAHLLILGRRNGYARGIYNRLVAGDPSSGRQILSDVQWRLNAHI